MTRRIAAVASNAAVSEQDLGDRRWRGLDGASCFGFGRFAQQWQLPVANAFAFKTRLTTITRSNAGDVGIGISPALALSA